MAPPSTALHKQEHHDLLKGHGDKAEGIRRSSVCVEVPPMPCSNPKCEALVVTAAKFCMMCGEVRPKVISIKPKKPSALEADCVSHSGCRHAVWLFVHTEVRDSPFILRHAQSYELMTILFVIYLVLADIIVSIPSIGAVSAHSPYYLGFEAFIYAVFTAEYVMRIWSSMESKTLSILGPIHGRIKIMRGTMEIVDFTVLVAYYINFIPGFEKLKGLQALRMIRLLRVAALLKMERKTSSFGQISNVLKTKKSELVATLFTAIVLMVMSATTMYYLESDEQPEAFSSVPAAMWWSVASLTTVGYGDVVPQTPAGKVLGALVAFFGVGLFALPAGILGSGFVEEVERAKRLALKEEEDDVEETLMDEEKEEANKIIAMQEHLKELKGTTEEMQSSQRDIANWLNSICPALEIPVPTIGGKPCGGVDKHVSDKDLATLQDSVTKKLDSLKLSKARPRKAA